MDKTNTTLFWKGFTNKAMITFLNKIAKLASIQNVLLLSHQGEMLFCETNQPSLNFDQHTASSLHTVISDLKHPKTANLRFKQGFFYLHSTTIGYIIIAMQDEKSLKIIKEACQNIEKKLRKDTIGTRVLLNMLAKANDSQKPPFIRALAPMADKDVAITLMKMISQSKSISVDTRDEVLLVACQTIGHSAYFKATDYLNALLTDHKSKKHCLDFFIVEALQIAIRRLQQAKPQEHKTSQPTTTKNTPAKQKQQSRNSVPVPVGPSVPQLLESLPERRTIEALATKNQKPKALKIIIGLIETAARNKQFDKAEALQEWLLQIEPMALTESIRAAELIEESKKSIIDEEFYFVWKGLVKILSNEEFIGLYHAMHSRVYASGEDIAQQGQIQTELFFVHNGRVQLYTLIEGRQIPLQIVQEGGLLGHDTFFELSVWTNGAKSQGAKIYSLSFDNLQKLEQKFPGIESKLSDYCSRLETSTALLLQMKRSRRDLERKEISGKLSFVMLRVNKEDTEVTGKGTILDISQGGLCFTVHSSKRKNTHHMFGRTIQIMIKRSNSNPPLERTGKVLAVRDHDIIGNTYSVHIQFDTLIPGSDLREIVSFNR